MSWRRVSRGLGELVVLVVIPLGGLYGALTQPLTPLSAGLYLAMMGLVPGARVLDLLRRAAEVAERDESEP
jgi:hypothetical protein